MEDSWIRLSHVPWNEAVEDFINENARNDIADEAILASVLRGRKKARRPV